MGNNNQRNKWVREFKLTIELVPANSWYKNLRNAISQTTWNIIRRKAYEQYNYRCGIYKASRMVHYHEKWEYDNKKHVQKLIGFIALCLLSHWVKHISLVGIRAQEGKLSFEQIIQRFIKINNCNRKAFEEHRDDAFKKWQERSKHVRKVEIGKEYFYSSS